MQPTIFHIKYETYHVKQATMTSNMGEWEYLRIFLIFGFIQDSFFCFIQDMQHRRQPCNNASNMQQLM